MRPPPLKGIVLDDTQARKFGEWTDSANSEWARVGTGYIHDGNGHKGEIAVQFQPEITKEGDYEIMLLYPPHANRATNVLVTVSIVGLPHPTVKEESRL